MNSKPLLEVRLRKRLFHVVGNRKMPVYPGVSLNSGRFKGIAREEKSRIRGSTNTLKRHHFDSSRPSPSVVKPHP
jgi:hypothetical protein